MMMLRAMATSAAASPMMNSTKIWPDRRVGRREAVERHEVQRGGGEDQFAGDQHADERAAADQAVDADGQQEGGDDEVDVRSVG